MTHTKPKWEKAARSYRHVSLSVTPGSCPGAGHEAASQALGSEQLEESLSYITTCIYLLIYFVVFSPPSGCLLLCQTGMPVVYLALLVKELKVAFQYFIEHKWTQNQKQLAWANGQASFRHYHKNQEWDWKGCREEKATRPWEKIKYNKHNQIITTIEITEMKIFLKFCI